MEDDVTENAYTNTGSPKIVRRVYRSSRGTALPTRVKVLSPHLKTMAGTRLGSTAGVNESMANVNAAVLMGADPVEAARREGYAAPESAAYSIMKHSGLAAYNRALFAKHGFTEDDIATGIIEGTQAMHTVKDGRDSSVLEPDWFNRHSFFKLVAGMFSMTPEAVKIESTIINNNSVSVNNNEINVTTGLEHLTGKDLLAAYKARMSQLSTGELAEAAKKGRLSEVYGQTITGGRDLAETVRAIGLDVARNSRPSTTGSTIIYDPISGGVDEIIYPDEGIDASAKTHTLVEQDYSIDTDDIASSISATMTMKSEVHKARGYR